jgi:hypothetical protein
MNLEKQKLFPGKPECSKMNDMQYMLNHKAHHNKQQIKWESQVHLFSKMPPHGL